jgi:Mrp family chromosome partitioning ATPase
LAAGYALLKKKTVMLEFDLRRPHISKDLGLDGHGGISNILTEESKIDDLLVEVKDHNGYLFILPAGYVESNPAELISGPNVPVLIQKLQARFDYIIINTPPLNLVTDAALLEEYADIILIVLRQDHTSREVYNDVKHHKSRHPNAAVYLLLNDVGKRNLYPGRNGYGRYAFGHAYGYYHEKK